MLTPMDRVLRKTGWRCKELADNLGIHKTTVHRWGYPPERGGTGGIIPLIYWTEIKRLSEGKVEDADFIPAA